MNGRKLMAAALTLAVCAGQAALAQPGGRPGGYAAKAITLDASNFKQSLVAAVGPKVKGMQYVLIKDGRVVSEMATGLARTAEDGGARGMTVRTPINIGSLMKFMTGTAFINMMEHPTQWSPGGASYSLRTRLDRPIWGEFPKVWLDLIPGPGSSGPTVRSIKYRQLLQHRSGFNGYGVDDPRYKADGRTVLGYLGDANGFLEDRFGKRQYANINFVMAGYLLPLYERPYIVNEMQAVIKAGWSDDQADTYVRGWLGKRYDEIMHERIWDKMKPSINPSCDAANKLMNTVAYGYATRDSERGLVTSAIDKKGHCTGEGGYYMSTRDLANYLAHFGDTNLIVSKEGRDAMYVEGMNPDDRLVWAGATDREWRSYDWFEQHFKAGTMVWSAGGTEGTEGVIIRLPRNHYLALVVNSNDLTVRDLFNAGADAFIAATKHNFE